MKTQMQTKEKCYFCV